MKLRVPDQEVEQRTWKGCAKKCQAHKLNREDAIDCNIWKKLIKDG